MTSEKEEFFNSLRLMLTRYDYYLDLAIYLSPFVHIVHNLFKYIHTDIIGFEGLVDGFKRNTSDSSYLIFLYEIQ